MKRVARKGQVLAALLKSQHRKLTGIDMETYGVYSAADEAPLPQPSVFALKSVCDFADERKNDDFQAYAAYTSAEACGSSSSGFCKLG